MSTVERDRAAEQAIEADVPHAMFCERGALAAWLTVGRRPPITMRLRASDFLHPWHQTLFDLLVDMDHEGIDATPMAIHHYATRHGVTDHDRLMDLHTLREDATTLASGDPGWFVDELLSASRARADLELGQRLRNNPEGADVAHADYRETVADISRRAAPVANDSFARHFDDAVGRYAIGVPPAIDTGLYDLDTLTGGLRPGGVSVVAAKPGTGKSILVTSVADHVASHGLARVGFVSMEMSEAEVQNRLIAGVTGIHVNRLARGGDRLSQGDWLAIDEARDRVRDWPLDVRAGSFDRAELRAYAERMAAQAPRSVLIVDYLQRVREDQSGVSRERHVAQVSNTLKDIAVDLDIAVLAVASVSRAAEARGGKPRMSDLRDSGSIEADADVVLLLWHDGDDPEDRTVKGLVDKNRHGPCGETTFIRDGETGRMRSRARL